MTKRVSRFIFTKSRPLKFSSFIPLLLVLFATSANSQNISGTWTGIAKQDATTYTYSIKIKKTIGDSIYGLTISSSKNFYSETKFRGIVKGTSIQLIETELVKTNYKGVGSVCLMRLLLTKSNNKLEGSFTSSNKDIKDCGSGTISLNLVKEKKGRQTQNQENKQPPVEQPSPQKARIEVAQPEKKNTTSTIQAPLEISNERKIEQRAIELLNTFRFKEDSVMIKVYDNGVIDGDVISLIVNGQLVFDKIKLTAAPLSYALKASSGSTYQIEFYAETLGEIPPNTGLITISSTTKTSEVLFSSDLKKSAAIKVVLNNFP